MRLQAAWNHVSIRLAELGQMSTRAYRVQHGIAECRYGRRGGRRPYEGASHGQASEEGLSIEEVVRLLHNTKGQPIPEQVPAQCHHKIPTDFASCSAVMKPVSGDTATNKKRHISGWQPGARMTW